ncbi:MAG: helix-turn-helix domain-containing protein [Verrucomicrobiota bacterium]
MTAHTEHPGYPKRPPKQQQNLCRTRLASYLQQRCYKSRSGFVNLDLQEIADYFGVHYNTIFRATKSIRTKDKKWMRIKDIVIFAGFDHKRGMKGSRRLYCFALSRVASRGHKAFAAAATRHLQQAWEDGKNRWSLDFLAAFFRTVPDFIQEAITPSTVGKPKVFLNNSVSPPTTSNYCASHAQNERVRGLFGLAYWLSGAISEAVNDSQRVYPARYAVASWIYPLLVRGYLNAPILCEI